MCECMCCYLSKGLGDQDVKWWGLPGICQTNFVN
jgi:hypothetical protein